MDNPNEWNAQMQQLAQEDPAEFIRMQQQMQQMQQTHQFSNVNPQDNPHDSVGTNTSKNMMSLSLSVSSISLIFLVICTLAIAAETKCPKGRGNLKQGPIVIACFVLLLAVGAWKLKTHLLYGFSVMDTLPSAYAGNWKTASQTPRGYYDWMNWTLRWIFFFVFIVGGGVFILHVYSLKPLEDACPQEDKINKDGEVEPTLLDSLVVVKQIAIVLIILFGLLPLGAGIYNFYNYWKDAKANDDNWLIRSMKHAQDSLKSAREEASKTKQAGISLFKGPVQYTKKGSTELYNAAYMMAELAGYDNQRLYANTQASSYSPENADEFMTNALV